MFEVKKPATFRVVTRGPDGELRIRDYDSAEDILKRHHQIGIEDCSTNLDLRGQPVFRGLIGPMPEGPDIVRYESPDVFEVLTKEWVSAKTVRRTRAKPRPADEIQPPAEDAADEPQAE